MKRIMFFAVVGVIAMFALASCNDDNNVEPKSFKVRMTDSPGNYTALNMTITSVEAYNEDHGWITLSSQTQTVNVASLTNGAEIELANASNVQTGMYTHLRIKFASNASITVNATGSGSGINFNLAWASPQEVDILINKQVTAGTGANILVDFDVAQSIVQVGSGYTVSPVIREVKNETTGAKGRVQGASSAAIVFTGGGYSYGGYMNSQGYFYVRGMQPGTYNVTVYKNSETNQQQQINGVVITEGQVYQMGTIQF